MIFEWKSVGIWMDSTKKTTIKDLVRKIQSLEATTMHPEYVVSTVSNKKHKTRQFVHFLPQNTSVIDSLRSLRFDLLVAKVVEQKTKTNHGVLPWDPIHKKITKPKF